MYLNSLYKVQVESTSRQAEVNNQVADNAEQLKNQMVQMNKVHRISAHYTPGNGHLGCAKSHLDAIRYANDNGFENIIVLEDDFKFSTDKELILDKFLLLSNTKALDSLAIPLVILVKYG